MGAFDWLFGKQEVPGRAQAAFDHPKIYREVESGPGVAAMSQAAADWREKISAAFAEAESALDRVLKDSSAMMRGTAGDQARAAVTPLSQATRGSIEVAAQAGAAVQQQAQGSADFKNAFPAPYQMPPDNIGWTDYVNPASYAHKSGVRASHEEAHDEVGARARQQYESYTQATNGRVDGIQRFDPPPKFTGDVTSAETKPVRKVDPQAMHPETESTSVPPPSTQPNSGSSAHTSNQPPATNPAQPSPEVPAISDSSWTTPSPASGGTTPPPAIGTPGGPGGSVVGGAAVPPGGAAGAPGAGQRDGSGTGRGADSSTGRGGTGSGVRGGPGALGSGGRAGVGGTAPLTGGTTNSTSSGGSARSGVPGGVPGGAVNPGDRRQRDDKDDERTNEYLEPTSEAWHDLGLPKVAPPVFGDWSADDGDKPPRPPEADR